MRRHFDKPYALALLWGILCILWIAPPAYYASSVGIPYLLSRGLVLYQDVIAQYPPLYLLFNAALTPLFPDPQLRVLALHLASYFALVGLAHRDGGKSAGLFVAVWFPFLASVAFSFEVMAALLLYLAYRQRREGFLCGLLCGAAVMVKPQAVVFALCLASWQVWRLCLSSAWSRFRGSGAGSSPSTSAATPARAEQLTAQP